jgi:hypothetical protein
MLSIFLNGFSYNMFVGNVGSYNIKVFFSVLNFYYKFPV